MGRSQKFLPESDDTCPEEIFDFVFLEEEETIQTIYNHGRIMFIIRGPPGTWKKSLGNMIKQKYDGVIYSASDDYPRETYFRKSSDCSLCTQKSLNKQHVYCQERVKQACSEGTHPIIVSNTHVRKTEMQKYLILAAEYGYTVILVTTVDKFKISSENLSKCNGMGLTKEYFDFRLTQWREVFPILTGWFLCSDDCYFIIKQLQSAVKALLGDEKFCRVFDAVDKDQLFKDCQAREVLFAVAAYSQNSIFELKKYNTEVKGYYGKFFKLFIEAFIITETDFFAVVSITNEMKHLMWEPAALGLKDSNKDDDISMLIRRFPFTRPKTYQFKSVPLQNDFSDKIKTAKLEENESSKLNSNKVTFIHIAQKGKTVYTAWEYVCKFKKSFISGTNSFGDIPLNSSTQLEGGYSMLRLPNEKWLVKPAQRISVDTIFTGLYI